MERKRVFKTRPKFYRQRPVLRLLLLVLVLLLGPFAANGNAQGSSGHYLFKPGQNDNLLSNNLPENVRPFLSALGGKYPGTEWRINTEKGFANFLSPVDGVSTGGITPKLFSDQFLGEFSALFGIRSDNVDKGFEVSLKRERLVKYRQVHNNIPVLNSYISFTYKDNILSGVSSRVHPGLDVHVPSTTPRISGANACDSALNEGYIRTQTFEPLECNVRELVIIPREHTIMNNESEEFYLAWIVSIKSNEKLFSETYFIDAMTGKVLNRYTNIVSQGGCGIWGHVAGYIYPKRATDKTKLRNFQNMRVILQDGAIINNAVTDAIGIYSSKECASKVSFQLQGYEPRKYVKVIDCKQGKVCNDIVKSIEFDWGPYVNYTWDPVGDDLKMTTVFWHLNTIHDYFEDLLGTDAMNYLVTANVENVDDGGCLPGVTNSYYFFGESKISFCACDTSKESDLIYHEYTHGVIDHIPHYVLPYQDEGGAMHEGFADYFAAAKNDDAAIGEGIFTPSLRNLNDVIDYDNQCAGDANVVGIDPSTGKKVCTWNPSYRCNCTGSPCSYLVGSSANRDCNDNGYVHYNSLAVSGSLWDLRQNRGLNSAFVDDLVITTVYKIQPTSIPGLLLALLQEDPSHEIQIREAFATRGVGADLIESSLIVTAFGPLAPGATFSVMDTVNNRGTVPAEASKTRYYLSRYQYNQKGYGEILLSEMRLVPALGIWWQDSAKDSGTTTLTVPTGTSPGSYYVMACANDLGEVIETNTSNNCIASTGTVQVATSPPTCLPGNTLCSSDLIMMKSYNAAGFAGSSLELDFVDSYLATVLTGAYLYIPYGQIDGLYPEYPITIAATLDGAGRHVRLGRVGIDGGWGNAWIWDATCSASCFPGIGYIGEVLPAWDGNVDNIPSQSFQIVPVPHNSWSHSRFPTSGYSLLPTDRPQVPDENCVDNTPISTFWDSGCGGQCTRTQTTCSDVMQGAGLTSVRVFPPGKGRFTIETFGKITPPVTFYIKFSYEKPPMNACNVGWRCRSVYPPEWQTFIFTVH